MPVPVWAAIAGIAVAKKLIVYAAAKMYGIPRVYRKSQRLARWSIRDKPTLKIVSGRIGYIYRVPNTFAARWFRPGIGQTTKGLTSSAVPLQKAQATHAHSLLKPSFASSSFSRTAPGLGPLDTALCHPAAAAVLCRLGKPFNFVRGHASTGWGPTHL